MICERKRTTKFEDFGDEMKYMPMICERKRTTKFEDFGDEIQMKNLDIVRRRPRVEQNTIGPTKMKEICCDQKSTSMSSPNQCTAISIPFVIGSTLPTRSKTMLTVLMNIFQMQYSEKKYPRKLKY